MKRKGQVRDREAAWRPGKVERLSLRRGGGGVGLPLLQDIGGLVFHLLSVLMRAAQ